MFRERLSDKVHATTSKGTVGGFEFTVFPKKFERMAGEAVYICLRVLKESNKSRFDNYSVRNSVLNISHIAFRDCRVHIFPTTFLEIVVNTLARSGGPTRPRRDNQSMRECCSQLHLFFSYKRSRKRKLFPT